MEVVVDQDKQQRGKGRTGTLENPETYENVPGHVIPIIEREFDDFDNEAEQFLAGELEENQFIGFRLKQGVYGQRQPDVQMIRDQAPRSAASPRSRWRPSPASSRSTRRSTRATSRRARTSRSTTCRCATPSCCCARSPSPGLSSREGCGNTIRNVTGDPWAGVAPDEVFDPTPYAGAYVRYFVRHPTTQLMPRKIKTSFTGSDEDRAISGIHDIAFLSRERDGVKGFEVRVGGGTSIMARVAPTLYEFVEADNGDYLKVAEAVLRIFDRQEWLRVNRARARIKVLIDKIGIDAFREQVDAELEGDWVEEREFDVELSRLRYDDDEEAQAPPRSPPPPASPNGDRTEFERFVEGNVQAQRQEGFSTVEVKIDRGDLTPEQFRGLGAIMREYTGGYARSTVQQNFVLRWVRDEFALRRLAAPRRPRPRRGRPADDHRRRQLPRHRQLQTRDHQLDGPQPGDQGAGRGDGDLRLPDQADPHQDERLPERLQPAPHRQHRLLRRLAEGRRPPDARLHPAHRRQLRGRRGHLRHPAQIAAARPNGSRRRSSAGSGSTRPSAPRARSSTRSPSGSAPSASKPRSRI